MMNTAAWGQVPPTAQPSAHIWEVANASSQVNQPGLTQARAEDRYIYDRAHVPELSLNGIPEHWVPGWGSR